MNVELNRNNLLQPFQQVYRQMWASINSSLRTTKICLRYLPGRPTYIWRQIPLLARLVKMGYYQRAAQLINFNISRKRILDVGCGTGFYGPLYLLLGAEEYTGCDYKLSLSSPMARNYRTWCMEDMEVTPQELIHKFDNKLLFYEGGWGQLPPNVKYDIVTMYLVTEHLIDIESAFKQVYEHLVPGGRLLFLHHNFYCWNGHHQVPQTVNEINSESEEQRKYLDWNHLCYRPRPHEYVARSLNRIRLDELRDLTKSLFHIENWTESKSDVKHGINRLTPEILESFPEYTERELTTQSVKCVAVKGI